MQCRRCGQPGPFTDPYAVHCEACVSVLKARQQTVFDRWKPKADAKGPVPKPRVPYLDPPTEEELIELRGRDGSG